MRTHTVSAYSSTLRCLRSCLSYSTLALLNFLSGYRTALHRLTTRGAWSTILSLVLSAHLADNPKATPLTTQGMLAASPSALAALAQIQTHVETDHPTLGSAVRVGTKDEEAIEILELVAETVKSTGQVLKSQGKRNLGQWVLEALKEVNGDAGQMVYKVSEWRAAGDDVAARRRCEGGADGLRGDPSWHRLSRRSATRTTSTASRLTFSKKPCSSSQPSTTASPPMTPPRQPSRFPASTTSPSSLITSCPVSRRLPNSVAFDTHNNGLIMLLLPLAAMLLYHKILDPSASTDPLLSTPPRPFLLPRDSATRLRAAAVTVCAQMVKRMNELSTQSGKEWMAGVTEGQLDGWLWTGAKEEGLREVERMMEKLTVYY